MQTTHFLSFAKTVGFFVIFIVFSNITNAQNDTSDSPYFFVNSEDANLDRMPLKSTEVDVTIVGVIADVTVKQVYANTGENPLEAVYIFPGSTQAAVYGMTMTIGDRILKAEIKTKKNAKKTYEKALKKGKRASLLQQHKPNVFQMNVANIMPGDVIEVELKYTELLIPSEGEYQFVYPKVVGPRYVEAGVSTNHSYANTPYLANGDENRAAFNITVNLNAGMIIQNLIVPNHPVVVEYPSLKEAKVLLDKTQDKNAASDYILNYTLKGEKIESGLLLFEGEEENFFLMTVQPPKIIEPKDIPAREYIFIVDISGSMRGTPLNTSKTLLRNLIGNLRPIDKFNVMLFAGASNMLNEKSVEATEENIELAINTIDNQRGGGSTNMFAAIKKVMAIPKKISESRSFIIVTDGYVTAEDQMFGFIRNNLNKANFYAFGIGNSVNRHLIEGIAEVGMSEPFIVTKNSEAAAVAERMRKYIAQPVLTSIKFENEGIEVYDMEPVSIPDVLSDRPILIYGKYKGKSPQGKMKITGYSGENLFTKEIEVSSVKPNAKNEALKYLWARKRIQLLDDYRIETSAHRENEVTALGLKYNLLTKYTSFVAVDNEKVNQKEVTKVKQPVALPKGVSNSAVGFDAPEISNVDELLKKKIAIAVVKNIIFDNASLNSKVLEQLLKDELSKFQLHKFLNQNTTVKITIDSAGKITSVEVLNKNITAKELMKINFLMKTIDFSELHLTESVNIQFEIEI